MVSDNIHLAMAGKSAKFPNELTPPNPGPTFPMVVTVGIMATMPGITDLRAFDF